MKRGSQTLEELAVRTGISAATLSRALNRPEMVRPELRARALKFLDDANYIPNGGARSLALRQTKTMGAVIPTVDSALFARLVDGFQKTIQERGYQLLLTSTSYSASREAAEVRALVERGVDGLLLVGRTRDRKLAEILKRHRVPVVTSCHYERDSSWPCVGWDNVAEASRIAQYLIDLGHRRFGVLAGIMKDNDRASDRVLGFRNALERKGIELPPQYVIERPYSIPDARGAVHRLLRLPDPPTAIMCGNDILAYGALQECLWQGVRVPDEVSITGFDDIDMAAYCRPGITTLHVPAHEVGQLAAKLILGMSEDQAPEHIYLNLELIVRGSTAAPALKSRD